MLVDPDTGTSCRIQFDLGEKYLISSWQEPIGAAGASDGAKAPSDLVVRTGLCSRSRAVEHAQADIEFIRQYTTDKQPARIYGAVRIHATRGYFEAYPPLPGATMSILPEEARTTATDGSGYFEFPDVPPGKHYLSARSPGFETAAFPVNVPANGCGVANIGLFTGGAIGGRVIEEDGSPGKGISVEYVYAEKRFETPFSRGRHTRTDEHGGFRFIPVPPGEFFVGVHIDTAPESTTGIPPTYSPGVANQRQAQAIRLAASETNDELVIRLGPRLVPIKLRVRAQWPDGRPAPSARVDAKVNDRIAVSADTYADGRAVLSVLPGVEYALSARAWTKHRVVHGNRFGVDWVDSEAKTVSADPAADEVILELNQPRQER